MEKPTLTNYVQIIFTLFDMFVHHQHQNNLLKPGRPFTFAQKAMLVLFTMLQFRRIFRFKAQQRWLSAHPEILPRLGFEQVPPHRTTLSRRYKQLYATLQAFVAFIGQYAATLEPTLRQAHMVSLFKALGPVMHQADRQAGCIPAKLRYLDQEVTCWSKSAYQGWDYGYGLHLACNEAAFPALVQVETTAYPECRSWTRKPILFYRSSSLGP